MKRAVTISKFLIYPVLGVMLSACNKDAVEATCASQETQTTLAKLISEAVESKLSDERHSDGSFIFEQSKIRAAVAQTQITLESVRTDKEDPNSNKKFCAGSLKITIPTTMLNEINDSGELFTKVKFDWAVPSSWVKISQYARELGFDNGVNNVFKRDVTYSVQPTDDKKELFVESETTIPVSMLTRITSMALLKSELELKKATQATEETLAKAQQDSRRQEIEKLQKEADFAKEEAEAEAEKARLQNEKKSAKDNVKNQEPVKDKGLKTRLAFSEKLGVEVYANGSKWCKQSIDLIIKIDDFSPLVDSNEMESFIPKLKAPIEGECRPAAIANITVVDSKGAEIGYYKSYKSGSWYAEIIEK
jgi:hypothetical protein